MSHQHQCLDCEFSAAGSDVEAVESHQDQTGHTIESVRDDEDALVLPEGGHRVAPDYCYACGYAPCLEMCDSLSGFTTRPQEPALFVRLATYRAMRVVADEEPRAHLPAATKVRLREQLEDLIQVYCTV